MWIMNKLKVIGGKKTKIRKNRRCYMKTEDQENAKKELGMI